MATPAGSTAALVAYTVQDASLQQAPELRLIHQHMSTLPPGLAALRHLKKLDCSDNTIQQIEASHLPASLQQLSLTGCAITSLPRGLSGLTNLQQLFLSANSITDISPVLACPGLLHLNVSYNHISHISTPPATLQQCPLMVLDMSHNDITRVAGVASALSQLPKMQALCIRGNPICLDPSKRAALLQCIPQLQYIDHQSLDGLVNSGSAGLTAGRRSTAGRLGSSCGAGRPLSSNTLAAAADASPAAQLQLDVSSLSVAEPLAVTVANLQQVWGQQQAQQQQSQQQSQQPGQPAAGAEAQAEAAVPAAAPADGVPAAEQPDVSQAPVKPVKYHLEWQDAEGTSFCSMPLVLSVPDASSSTEAGGGGTAAAAPAPAAAGKPAAGAKAPAKPAKGAKGKSSAAEAAAAAAAAAAAVTSAGTAAPGSCKVQVSVDASIQSRDWLRNGVELRLVRTHMRPCRPQRAAPAQPPPGAKGGSPAKGAAAAAKKGSADAAASSSEWVWEYEMEQVPLAQGHLPGLALLDAAFNAAGVVSAEGSVPLMSLPALWDPSGRRLALKAAQQQQQQLASCRYRLQLTASS